MNPILEAMEQVRVNTLGDRVEIELEDPSRATRELMKRNGVRVESDQWIAVSEIAGYDKMTVAVPKSWLPSSHNAEEQGIPKLFEDGRWDDYVLFIIPDEQTGPRSVVRRYVRMEGFHCVSLLPRGELCE